MSGIKKIIFIFACLVLFLSFSDKVLAAGADCMCSTDLKSFKPAEIFKQQGAVLKAVCFDSPAQNSCMPVDHPEIVKDKLKPDCWRYDNPELCIIGSQEWKIKYDAMLESGKDTIEVSTNKESTAVSKLSSLIVTCGQPGKLSSWNKDCTDITVFVKLLLQLTNYLFGIIGALALGAFVYGGFQLILSQGNPEKVKAGTDAMINAVIGLAVAFGGYVLVSFLSEILKVKADFNLM
ncbi:MAG: hypothetical protein A2537_03700 [Candidatus Magasanikbacteria bacterium RIFOXYD2_FULL_36_9]|uniref:MotA/TolQ/ExbB proton channel domain-containing protein n=1 Tax=Candidatus Magasanikbacteria bacterium RIFOXYD2_FULL_36_9 TaxID=1798707 RepID=A0A1F6P1X2_9BACT|nr:MAG: hypothetical protein A2537_03700 [Candidatus Magasanikbacteria bacterium RIFOXYD2_FULL_36_9]